ncbi:unnamed protein product, partial [marine sediment metagenome]
EEQSPYRPTQKRGQYRQQRFCRQDSEEDLAHVGVGVPEAGGHVDHQETWRSSYYCPHRPTAAVDRQGHREGEAEHTYADDPSRWPEAAEKRCAAVNGEWPREELRATVETRVVKTGEDQTGQPGPDVRREAQYKEKDYPAEPLGCAPRDP